MTRPRRPPTRSQMRTALRREAKAILSRHIRSVGTGSGQYRVECRVDWSNPDAMMSDDNPGFTVGIGFDRQGGPRAARQAVAVLLDVLYPPDPVPAREPADTDLKEIKISGGPE